MVCKDFPGCKDFLCHDLKKRQYGETRDISPEPKGYSPELTKSTPGNYSTHRSRLRLSGAVPCRAGVVLHISRLSSDLDRSSEGRHRNVIRRGAPS